jgi:hypothetical protein
VIPKHLVDLFSDWCSEGRQGGHGEMEFWNGTDISALSCVYD